MEDSTFTKEQQDNLFALEDDSWWFNYRMDLIEKLTNKYFNKELPIIDVGGAMVFLH